MMDEQRQTKSMSALEVDLDQANRRAQDLVNEAREKDREMTRLRGNYDKVSDLNIMERDVDLCAQIKRKAILGGAAKAIDTVNNHLRSTDLSNDENRSDKAAIHRSQGMQVNLVYFLHIADFNNEV